MEWLEEAEAHLRIVQRAEKRRHMEEIIRLTLEVERLRKDFHRSCPKCLAERIEQDAP